MPENDKINTNATSPENTTPVSEEAKRREMEQYRAKIKTLLRDFGLENIFDDAIKNKKIKIDR